MVESRAGIPESSSVLMPRLVCHAPTTEIEFLVDTFDAQIVSQRPGPDGTTAHALLTIGPAMLMIEAEWPSLPGRAPVQAGTAAIVLFLYVQDVDATIARATSSGATVLVPLQDQFWGDRTCWITDPAGHVWTVASRIEDTTEEQRKSRWSSLLKDHQKSTSRS